MRPARWLCASLVGQLLVGQAALAQDARITFLAKQLSTAKDPRIRAQTAVILGGTNNPAAVAPLCQSLKDTEPVVRAAAAGALGELRLPEALACLKGALGEADATVRAALAKALTGGPKTGGLYINVEPITDKVGNLNPEVLKLTDELIRAKLTDLGAAFAPPGEAKPAAQALVKSKQLKSYQVRTNLLPHGSNGLKIEMLIMTYPDQALQGSWNVKASGAKFESLLKVMVPRVIDDAANELEWKQ